MRERGLLYAEGPSCCLRLISSTNVLSFNLILATFISKTFTVELDEVAYPLSSKRSAWVGGCVVVEGVADLKK